ncbi:unnamed protein product [Miscanthus lutarioriparius]|uniref:Rho-GAP domain-containing protein n=1 Tax=Miscanthus lutarioriparius TaxID=422564 RepID=A0A811NZC9_9POAL|nr:unnamed protein product [Miscanthus lutarioriparius]
MPSLVLTPDWSSKLRSFDYELLAAASIGQTEGIFRINPKNDQEEHARDQLNKGVVPEDIGVHCLASLIKAWFRELPEGVINGLSPEQVLQCNSEGEFLELVTMASPHSEL